MYKKTRLHIKGVSPLILHNGNLANPINPLVIEMKKISSKRKKTDADHSELARLEWLGSLYIKNGIIVVPGELIEAVAIDGAKKKRQGPQAKVGIFVEEPTDLIYDGPKDPNELINDENFRITAGVVISRSRIMRTRPIFYKWELKPIVTYEDSVVDLNVVLDFFESAGRLCGMGDWRPKFGRFEILSHDEI